MELVPPLSYSLFIKFMSFYYLVPKVPRGVYSAATSASDTMYRRVLGTVQSMLSTVSIFLFPRAISSVQCRSPRSDIYSFILVTPALGVMVGKTNGCVCSHMLKDLRCMVLSIVHCSLPSRSVRMCLGLFVNITRNQEYCILSYASSNNDTNKYVDLDTELCAFLDGCCWPRIGQ